MTGRYCECPIGHDCSNHTHFPELPSLSPVSFPTITSTTSFPKTSKPSVPADESKISVTSIFPTLSSKIDASESTDESVFSVTTSTVTMSSLSKDDYTHSTMKFQITSEQSLPTLEYDYKGTSTKGTTEEISIITPHSIPLPEEASTQAAVTESPMFNDSHAITELTRITSASLDFSSEFSVTPSTSKHDVTYQSSESSKDLPYAFTTQESHYTTAQATGSIDSKISTDSTVTKVIDYLTSMSSKYETTTMPEILSTTFSVKPTSESSLSEIESTVSSFSETSISSESGLMSSSVKTASTMIGSELDLTPVTSPVTPPYGITTSSADIESTFSKSSSSQVLSSTESSKESDSSTTLSRDTTFASTDSVTDTIGTESDIAKEPLQTRSFPELTTSTQER